MEKKDARDTLMFVAWATAVLAVFGSLFFSEIRLYEPCKLCWYQRILMYPFVVILGLATARRDFVISVYAMVLSFIGASISLYHYGLQKIPFLTENAPACGRIPCTGEYINWFGFITIPFLALTAFIIIFICNYMIWKRTREVE